MAKSDKSKPTSTHPETITGIFTLGKNGLGYIRTKEIEEVIEIAGEQRNTAMHRDTVTVKITGTSISDNLQGTVINIVRRSKAGYAGTLEQHGKSYVVMPSDHRDDVEITIAELPADIKIGDKVVANITEFTSHSPLQAIGTIARSLGSRGENDAEMNAIALEKGFDEMFPPEVLQEAETIQTRGITETDLGNRRDLRDLLTFTIDPADAKDFDDALSYQELPDGMFEIGIHIADVAYYVQPDTALDREAQSRATSVYLVDRTIPMLPEALSNNLCSLRPNEDRLAFSAIFTMDSNGTVHERWFGRSAIHSDHRFTYEAAQAGIDENTGPHTKELQQLNTIAHHLTQARFAAGAMNLEQDEVRFILDENGKPIDVYVKQRLDAHRLIEEFMLLANREVAKFLTDQAPEGTVVYRIHDRPEPERTEKLREFLRQLGHRVKMSDGIISAHELQRVLDEIESEYEKNTIQTAIIRTMAKAVYSTKNIGHYGLAFDYYTHFTSPIRRYPDIMVHRLLDLILQDDSIDVGISYEDQAKHSSQRERDAQEAEWASIKYKQVEYMSERIGEVYPGIVTGVTKNGLFVAEEHSRAEGMIPVRSLGDDYFVFDDKKLQLVGKKTKQRFAIGDRLQIKVVKADMEKQIIDYQLIS